MEISREVIFEEFLKELQVLDDFRTEYSSRYEFEGLERGDEDVQRLVEAMAFYRARTRVSVERAIQEYNLRALEQLFPYLLSPMPAMALLHPELASNFTDTRELPALAEMEVASQDLPVAESRPRLFRTLRQLQVFPLHVVQRSVRQSRASPSTTPEHDVPNGVAPPRMLQLQVAPSTTGAASKRYFDDPACSLRELTLYLNPMGDALSALRLFDALRQACTGVSVVAFDRDEVQLQRGPFRPRFSVGTDSELSGGDNPIEFIRRAIHFPLAHFSVTIPLVGLPSEWTRLAFEFQLNERWPEGVWVSEDSFVLNCVPLENLLRRTAEPALMDGTATSTMVQSAEAPAQLKVREVIGVYATDPAAPGARGMIFPRSLIDNGYQISTQGSGNERQVWLEPDTIAGVVGVPQTLYIDAEWYDPNVSLPNPRTALVRADAHDLGPLCWRLLDPLQEPQESPLLSDAALLERLLQTQGDPPRSAEHLKLLFKVIGVDASNVFGRIPRYIERVVFDKVPDPQSVTGSIPFYEIVLSDLPTVLAPAVRFLFSLLPRLLAVWTGDPDVQVSVAFNGGAAKSPQVFEWRSIHE